MGGIPAKCLHCGQLLAYDGRTWTYYCPNCEPGKPETIKPEELLKKAA